MVELEQQVEEARRLILETIDDEAAHEAASSAFLTALAALRIVERVLNGENE